MSSLSDNQKKELLKLARDSIKASLEKKKLDILQDSYEKKGAFVKLILNDELRGCKGFAMPIYPLGEAVMRAANGAAFEDSRFEPLDLEELDETEIEISVLSEPLLMRVFRPEEYLERINIGKDGLLVKDENSQGLLLPSVFKEYDCTPEQALQMTCRVAGFSKDAWKDPRVRVAKFQADTFQDVITE